MRAHLRLTPWLSILVALSTQAQEVVNDPNRRDSARTVRVSAAEFQRSPPMVTHANNTDRTDFGRWATYSKGLPHDNFGEPVPTPYDALLQALLAGDPVQLEAVLLGGERQLVNPQAGFAYVLEGADPQSLTMRPAPDFDSAEVSGEMEELYWMSLVRDVPFIKYPNNTTVVQAANYLNRTREYRGARASTGLVTASTIFRADVSGALPGPFISQFLLKPIPYGGGPLFTTSDVNPPPARVEPTAHQVIEQRIFTRLSGDDRVTAFQEWLDIQNGVPPADPVDTLQDLDGTRYYIRNGRDLAEWVHFDYPLQASLNAALLLARQGDFLANGKYDSDPSSSPRAQDARNPYRTYRNQEPFVTFGNSDVQSLLALVTNTVLRGQWFQKWQVHRRLRPEEYGGRVHLTKTQVRTYPVPADLLASQVLQLVLERNAQRNAERGLSTAASYLLPQAFPEGSPLHPSYGSGHSTYIGAGVTIIKAFYADFPIINPQMPSDDGTALVPYNDGTLMMFDELDKLASNVGVARLFAGVHYRSDHDHAVRLGELFALRTLQDWARLYREREANGTAFRGFEVRTFGGNTLVVTATGPKLPNHVSAVTSFALYDQNTLQPIAGYAPLYNGARIDLSDMAARGITRFNIRAFTYQPEVGSVRFVYDNQLYTEDIEPYFLAGDEGQRNIALTVGTHVLRAIPYSDSDAKGVGGVPLTIRITVQQ